MDSGTGIAAGVHKPQHVTGVVADMDVSKTATTTSMTSSASEACTAARTTSILCNDARVYEIKITISWLA